MKERPILFSAPMVRAILAGTKTQTRRLIDWKKLHKQAGLPFPTKCRLARFTLLKDWGIDADDGVMRSVSCPYGQPGDRLWVKETFHAQAFGIDDLTIRYVATPGTYHAHGAADGSVPDSGLAVYYRMFDKSRKNHDNPVSHPSIFMPRWASRITLEITGVRVERLQQISEADATAEGIDQFQAKVLGITDSRCAGRTATTRDIYSLLWEQINGPGSWAANPWVWVVEFRRVQP